MAEIIRCFLHPVLFCSRTLTVKLITLRSPIRWRKLAAFVRRHPGLALRWHRLQLVRPGFPVPLIHGEPEARDRA
ncbi:MAG TPA: hypothetical protein VN841_29295 [Bryobacteraceae bacterium]|nr:hypothetical protein [Bryobacteraceae bacterium]